jgi:hypothetical protein
MLAQSIVGNVSVLVSRRRRHCVCCAPGEQGGGVNLQPNPEFQLGLISRAYVRKI